MSSITTVIQTDVRNPNDKLIIDLFGMLEPFGPIINYVRPMVSSDVIYWFTRFATNKSLAIVIYPQAPVEAIALHRIYGMWGSAPMIDMVDLIVQNRTYVGTDHTQSIIKPTLRLTQVRITAVIPVNGDSGNKYHIVNLSVEGRRHWTEKEGDK